METPVVPQPLLAEYPPGHQRGLRLVVWLLMLTLLLRAVAEIMSLGLSLPWRMTLIQAAGVLLPAILFVRWQKLNLVGALRLNWPGGRPLVFAVMMGAGLQAVTVAALLRLKPWIGPFPAELLHLLPETWNDYLFMLLIGCAGAGVCEEVLFRGAIQGVLSRRGRWMAILLTAILFGLMHMNPWQLIGGVILGIALGWMVERSGSLLPAIIAHASVNAFSFSWFFGVGSVDVEAPLWLVTALAIFGVIGLTGFVIFTGGRPGGSSLREAGKPVPKLAWLAVLTPLALLGGTIGAGHAGVWQLVPVHFDLPELAIKKGECVVAISPAWWTAPLASGDGVLFTEEGRLCIGAVTGVENELLRVDRQGAEVFLARSGVTGRVLRAVRLPLWPPPAPAEPGEVTPAPVPPPPARE